MTLASRGFSDTQTLFSNVNQHDISFLFTVIKILGKNRIRRSLFSMFLTH